MSISKRFVAVCFAVFAVLPAVDGFAQDPFAIDSERWSSGTANTQAQGFNQGDPLKLTWGIAQEGMIVGQFSAEPNSPNNIRSFFNGIHGSEAVWQPIFQSSYDRWASISGLEFQYEANDDGAAWVLSSGILGTRADMRLSSHSIDGQFGNNSVGYQFFPNFADMVIDSDNSTFYSNSTNGFIGTRNVIARETGNGLGMFNLISNDSSQLMEPNVFSIDGPQYFDILSAQRGYGDFNEKSFGQLGNDDSSRATDLGAIADGGTVEVGQDARSFLVEFNSEDFVSIDDQSDTDFFIFSVAGDGTVDIVVEALGFTFGVGPEFGPPPSPFDSTTRSDLKLDLFNSSMVNIGSADLTGLGGMESLAGIAVTAGDYFVRITGADNVDSNPFDVQFYGLSAGFTLSPVPEPTSFIMFGTALLAGTRRRRIA